MDIKRFLSFFLSGFMIFSSIPVSVSGASTQSSQLQNVTSTKKMSKSVKIAIGIGTGAAALAVVGLSVFAFKKHRKDGSEIYDFGYKNPLYIPNSNGNRVPYEHAVIASYR